MKKVLKIKKSRQLKLTAIDRQYVKSNGPIIYLCLLPTSAKNTMYI
jgi:hypothetical protein